MTFEIRTDTGEVLPVRKAYLHMERKLLQKFSLVGELSSYANAAALDLSPLRYAVIPPQLAAASYSRMFKRDWEVQSEVGRWVVASAGLFDFRATTAGGRLTFGVTENIRPTWTSWFIVGLYVPDMEAFHVHYNRMELLGYRKKWGSIKDLLNVVTPVQSVGAYMLHKMQQRLSTQTKAFLLSRALRYDVGRFPYDAFDGEYCQHQPRQTLTEAPVDFGSLMEVL